MQPIDFAYEILDLFSEYDAEVYLAGGSVRDYLLYGDFDDFDFATPCTPHVVTTILDIDDYDKFSFKFGTIKAIFNNQEIQITTFRKEEGYLDFRHPSKIKFVKDIEIDSLRRDFTINAMYLDYSGKILDFHNGLDDLEKKLIRTVGDPLTKIKEDPTRILRAFRFALRFDFSIEENLKEAIINNLDLLKLISKERFKMEYKKMLLNNSEEEIKDLFARFNLKLEDFLV